MWGTRAGTGTAGETADAHGVAATRGAETCGAVQPQSQSPAWQQSVIGASGRVSTGAWSGAVPWPIWCVLAGASGSSIAALAMGGARPFSMTARRSKA